VSSFRDIIKQAYLSNSETYQILKLAKLPQRQGQLLVIVVVFRHQETEISIAPFLRASNIGNHKINRIDELLPWQYHLRLEI